MKEIHIVIGILAIALNAVTGLWGAWCWWQVRSSAWFWRLLRTAQLVVVLEVALGGVLLAIGRKTPSLHIVYGVLPIAVSLIAEQLRVASAQMVLAQRGLQSGASVAELPPDEQRAVVVSIVHREIGVMALAAVVVVVLLARAAATAG